MVKQKEYQPHPSTWLNQRRWEDDLINDKQNVYTPFSVFKQRRKTPGIAVQ